MAITPFTPLRDPLRRPPEEGVLQLNLTDEMLCMQGSFMTLVDVAVAPWFLRLRRVLQPYRGWPPPDMNSRLGVWIAALEASEAVKNTTSDDSLYIDSYERYAGESSLFFFLFFFGLSFLISPLSTELPALLVCEWGVGL